MNNPKINRRDILQFVGIALFTVVVLEYFSFGIVLSDLKVGVHEVVSQYEQQQHEKQEHEQRRRKHVHAHQDEGDEGAWNSFIEAQLKQKPGVVQDASAVEYGLRGWHWENRVAQHQIRFENKESRLDAHPYEYPMVEDSGHSYLPFDESLVSSKYRNSTRLIYDCPVIRLADDFGLIDDMYTPQEMEEFFQLVVNIFAKANIYVRIDREDLANQHRLNRRKSLEYLAYVEGPDLAEHSNMDKFDVNKRDKEYIEWYKSEYAKVSGGLNMLEDIVTRSNGLKGGGYTPDRYNYMRNMIDWIIGYPVLLTPWDLSHTTPLFPIFHFHGMNGECRGGRITGRTGSCWLEPKQLVDKSTGQFLRNNTCRRFSGSLKSRFRMGMKSRHVRDSEKRVMLGAGAARMWAHEIGHSLDLRHPSSKCIRHTKWSEANLMLQQRHVGHQSVGCPKTPTDDQAKGTSLESKQIAHIREFIRKRDIRPSRTLPGAETIGESTMQIGTRSEPVFRRMVFNRALMIGSGKNIHRSECRRPQAVIVFTKIPAPVDGKVYRVRWLPSHFRKSVPYKVQIQVVRRTEEGDTGATFRISSQSPPLTVPASKQRMHIELDLPEPLIILQGEFVSISIVADEDVEGANVNIDTKLYAHDRVLYGDVVGKFPVVGPSIHNSAMPNHLEYNTTYPKVLLSRRVADTFHSSGIVLKPGQETFAASVPSVDEKEMHCSELIFNYDLMK